MSDDAQVSEPGDALAGDAPATDDVNDAPVGDGSDVPADDVADEVEAEDESDDGDPVVQALIAALRSGNAGDAQNALALAAEAGHDVSAFGSVEIQGKRDLTALAAEAEEEAEAEAEAVEDDES